MMSGQLERVREALADRYAIERELGSGGMATVYLAEDLKHKRHVAVKVLRPELAAILGAERFLKEIEVTANLQHPNILPLHDSGEADGFLYYVMPYVEGESLRQKLGRERQLGVQETIEIAKGVAAALDYAHRQDVIHRDVKPENVLLYEGQALVADFGIALAVSQAGGTRITETGLSIGTPHYMSPEQASGDRELDGRTDVYSLGAMIYEMLVGRPPFDAASVQAVMSKILTEAPRRVHAERPAVPTNVDAAVDMALSKLPADRFATAAEFGGALTDPGFAIQDQSASAGASGPVGWTVWAALVLVAVLAAVGWLRQRDSRSIGQAISLSFEIPEGQLLAWADGPTLAISPKSDRIVYVGSEGNARQLYVRDLDDFVIRPLDGTDGAYSPIISPDGEWVAYFADGTLWKIPITGGIPTEIATPPEIGRGASWGEDGTILYAGSGWTLWRVRADGSSDLERIDLALDAGGDGSAPPEGGDAMWPDLLPGNRALVAIAFPGTIGIVDLSTGAFTSLGRGNRPYYLPSGHVVFYSGEETVSLVPFDPDGRRFLGPSRPIVVDAVRPAGSENRFVVSKETGALAYASGGFTRSIAIVERSGREEVLLLQPRGYRFPSVSPDGNWLAVTIDPQPPAIWMVDLRRNTAQPVTDDAYNLSARWFPDGAGFSFNRLRDDPPGLYSMTWPDGGDLSFISSEFGGSVAWVDSSHLIGTVRGQWDLKRYDIETGTSTEFVVTPAREGNPRSSPDGRWVAYQSDASGATEVYVLPYEGRSAPRPVSSDGGNEPHWSNDGSSIFYRRGNVIWEATVRTEPDFTVAGAPQPLFTANLDPTNANNWDVLPDGRFVVVKSGPNVGREVRLVFDWLEKEQ